MIQKLEKFQYHFASLCRSIIDLTERIGPLELPMNQTGSIEVEDLSLTGETGLWGKGLVLKDTYSPRTICASITVICS